MAESLYHKATNPTPTAHWPDITPTLPRRWPDTDPTLRSRVVASGYPLLSSSLLFGERGRSRVVAAPSPFFFCVQSGAGLLMLMRSKLGWWPPPPAPLFFLSGRRGAG